MTPCSNPNPVLTRIEKITKNQVVNPGSSPYDQMPEENKKRTSQIETPRDNRSPNNSDAPVLAPENMQSFVTPGNSGNTGGTGGNETVEIDGPSSSMTPELIPNAPTFTVPANPLLPPGYREILDYNAIQYVNGFYRTQIGRYVRVEQLMGSNTLDSQEGYLIGVGINYIILQEAPTGNILIVDIYGIKNMYVYYTYRENSFAPLNMNAMASGDSMNGGNTETTENPIAQTISNGSTLNHLQPIQR